MDEREFDSNMITVVPYSKEIAYFNPVEVCNYCKEHGIPIEEADESIFRMFPM